MLFKNLETSNRISQNCWKTRYLVARKSSVYFTGDFSLTLSTISFVSSGVVVFLVFHQSSAFSLDATRIRKEEKSLGEKRFANFYSFKNENLITFLY